MPIIKPFRFSKLVMTYNGDYFIKKINNGMIIFGKEEDETHYLRVETKKETVAILFYFVENDVPIIDLAMAFEKRKGWMYQAYKTLINAYGILYSDTQVSPESGSLWSKLSNEYSVTEEPTEYETITRFVARK